MLTILSLTRQDVRPFTAKRASKYSIRTEEYTLCVGMLTCGIDISEPLEMPQDRCDG
jgi:hypothetical protein